MGDEAINQDEIFRALADGTRRQILERLAAGEATVSSLVASIGMSQSAVSQHLRVLREASLVGERKSGRNRYYEIRPDPLIIVRDWVSHYEIFWEGKLQRLGATLRSRHGAQD